MFTLINYFSRYVFFILKLINNEPSKAGIIECKKNNNIEQLKAAAELILKLLSKNIVAPSRTPRLPTVIGIIFVNNVNGNTFSTTLKGTLVKEDNKRKLVVIDNRK